MIRKLTNNEIIVLGLLAESPRHGYDLHQTVNERGIREWTSLGLSSLYYLLEKLESKKLVAAILSDKKDKDRQVFTITDAGREMCSQAIRRALVTVEPYNPSLLISLANRSMLSQTEVAESLKFREAEIKDRLNSVIVTQKKQQPLPDFVDAIFDYNISLLKAERMWLQKTAAIIGTNSMDKIDLKKEFKNLYSPSAKEFSIIKVPEMSFLMIDGQGNPNTAQSYKEAVEALYAVAYTIKFTSKKQLNRDYSVLPLEGLWTADAVDAFTEHAKDTWKWTMMIMQPEWITHEIVESAIESARAKKNPKALNLLRFEPYDEGEVVQIMHVGSYDDEAPTLHTLHTEFMPQHQLTWNGPHHEIYLGDPRKTDPSKLKTVLRQPVKNVSV